MAYTESERLNIIVENEAAQIRVDNNRHDNAEIARENTLSRKQEMIVWQMKQHAIKSMPTDKQLQAIRWAERNVQPRLSRQSRDTANTQPQKTNVVALDITRNRR